MTVDRHDYIPAHGEPDFAGRVPCAVRGCTFADWVIKPQADIHRAVTVRPATPSARIGED